MARSRVGSCSCPTGCLPGSPTRRTRRTSPSGTRWTASGARSTAGCGTTAPCGSRFAMPGSARRAQRWMAELGHGKGDRLQYVNANLVRPAAPRSRVSVRVISDATGVAAVRIDRWREAAERGTADVCTRLGRNRSLARARRAIIPEGSGRQHSSTPAALGRVSLRLHRHRSAVVADGAAPMAVRRKRARRSTCFLRGWEESKVSDDVRRFAYEAGLLGVGEPPPVEPGATS